MNDKRWQPATGLKAAWERAGAAIYDPFLARGEEEGMQARRHELLARAQGRVLELGAGTGLNVDHYPAGLDRLVLTEPVAPMAERLRRRAANRADVEVVEAPAEILPFANASFDTVVSTMVLCTVDNVEDVLVEIARVLAPGGTLLFVEHVHAPGTRLGRWQTRLAGPWAGFAQGCRCDHDFLAALEEQFEVVDVRPGEWSGMPALVRPLVTGSAVPTRTVRPHAWAHHTELVPA